MTAISKAWITIADGQLDPDSPIDAALMQGLRDDLVHLREWTGAGYYAGAVQNHSHDGVNSALVEVGPNLLRNNSFEQSSTSWTLTAYTGGTLAVQTTGSSHGKYCMAITSTVLANGGGYVDSNEYIPVSRSSAYLLSAIVSASVANVSNKIEVLWYDGTPTLISASTASSSSNESTSSVTRGGTIMSPSTAIYAKVRISGGVPGVGSATGTTYIDGVYFADCSTKYEVFTSSGAWTKPINATGTERVIVELWGGGGGGSSGGASAGGGGAYNRCEALMSDLGATVSITVGAGGTADAAGGTSAFGGIASAYAFGGAAGTNGVSVGGGGGGAYAAAVVGVGGKGYSSTTGAAVSTNGVFDGGGGGGSSSGGAGGSSTWGGGGGGAYSGTGVGGAGGFSLFGGGGGGGAGTGGNGAAGVSLYGGHGGTGNAAGSAKGGGGGAQAGIGGRGEVRVWIVGSRG